ncbi:hypothetical protein KKG29_03055 [Patescibacteria group bacterium]|nr:hypothetical protein [Patescibacteria group bacterium]MBU4000126.1 hypothetical protein [Patescibacteria group bacterium]MBU4368318.1 hypothetical protein [Patescibacteria group bacterium]
MPAKKKKTNSKKTAQKIGVDASAETNLPEVIFSWETADFIKNPKMDFYLLAAIFGAMIMIVWGIYGSASGGLTVATFALLAAVCILMLNDSPRKIKARISEHGIDIVHLRWIRRGRKSIKDNQSAKTHYEFGEFKSFWISYLAEMPVLNLKYKRPYLPVKIIYLEKEPVKDIEDFLEIYLPRIPDNTKVKQE